MQFDIAGNLRFAPNGRQFQQCERLDVTTDGKKKSLEVWCLHDVGFLCTDRGCQIHALRLRQDSVWLRLLEANSSAVLQSYLSIEAAVTQLGINKDIVVGYNCHGFCFAQSQYWVNNEEVDAILNGDRYVTVDDSRAEVVLFRHKGQIVHSCLATFACDTRVYPNKAGIRGIEHPLDLQRAARDNPFDEVAYFSKQH